ncbi:MAG: DJ-1/PfpI family protein, partial [Pseudomonadota bacterium]|nr:DJ-1/PfpI family protein [Pseudomonadota bacterium]
MRSLYRIAVTLAAGLHAALLWLRARVRGERPAPPLTQRFGFAPAVPGRPAWIYAASAGKTEIVKLLLDAGADTTLETLDGFTALDAVGPYEVLSRLPGAEVIFAAREPGVIGADSGMIGLAAEVALDDLAEVDVLVVPGGRGTRTLLEDDHLLGWIRRAHSGSQWTTSVCTGSLLLAAAGILDGVRA